MTILRAQVNIRRTTLLPVDDVINTWHFLTVGAASPQTAATAAMAQLVAFYQAIDVHFAAYCSSTANIKVYDLQEDEPRVPIDEGTIALTVGAGNSFPAEVAVCISYRAELLSGTNPARRRGRIFLGPLDADGQTTDTVDCRVSSTLRTAIANAGEALIVAGQTGDARWVVFSPTLAGPPPWSEATLEASSADTVAGFVDNAFDIIRSRGSLATSRTIFSDVLP